MGWPYNQCVTLNRDYHMFLYSRGDIFVGPIGQKKLSVFCSQISPKSAGLEYQSKWTITPLSHRGLGRHLQFNDKLTVIMMLNYC